MKRLILVVIAFLPLSAFATPVVDEATVRAIAKEIAQGVRDTDISVLKKYLHPESRIVVDLDPALNSGKQEISYDEYMALTEMSFQFMAELELHDEVISVSVDEANNQATIEEKTIATVNMMGVKMQDVSLSKTTYGVIDGQIKVLYSEGELLSSGPVE